jgi:hypothetical protein
MSWKFGFLLIILGGAIFAYVVGSAPRKHRPLSKSQPVSSRETAKPELGMEAIDTSIVEEARSKNAALAATTGARGIFAMNKILNGVVSRYGVDAMRKKYNRD